MNKFPLRSFLQPTLEGRKILLGVTGSIAAFKACDLVRFLKECGADVRVVLTESAKRFVTPLTLETLSGERVYTSMWPGEDGNASGPLGTHHIEASRWADLFVVAPASANVIAESAHGLAGDLLTTELLAFNGPILIAPAMNPSMWGNAATQANIKTLASRGVKLLGPTVGVTACGEAGRGRMLEPDEIVEEIARCFYKPANGKRVIVTLGPTRSYLDPVRYLTNRSSGLMGAALCWAAAARGYDVTAVAGPTESRLPKGIETVRVTTAAEMEKAVLERWPHSHIFIGAAAVLDWDVANPAAVKLKKELGAPALKFKQNTDILATVSAQKHEGQFVLGFAAETEEPTHNALLKLITKGCDAIFANDVSKENVGFESEDNAGWWIDENVHELKPSSKAEIARQIFSNVEART